VLEGTPYLIHHKPSVSLFIYLIYSFLSFQLISSNSKSVPHTYNPPLFAAPQLLSSHHWGMLFYFLVWPYYLYWLKSRHHPFHLGISNNIVVVFTPLRYHLFHLVIRSQVMGLPNNQDLHRSDNFWRLFCSSYAICASTLDVLIFFFQFPVNQATVINQLQSCIHFSILSA